jgi:hypothetical protein
MFVGHTYLTQKKLHHIYTVIAVMEGRMATIVVMLMLILGCFAVLSQCKFRS